MGESTLFRMEKKQHVNDTHMIVDSISGDSISGYKNYNSLVVASYESAWVEGGGDWPRGKVKHLWGA